MYEMENISFEEIESETRLQQLAVEIITFDRQAKITAVSCAIEIGERLLEAKDLVPHGEWGKWLKENVNYSQSTANNFMRLYKEYGNNQGSLFTTVANSQAIMNLDVSKALALTVLPPEEREEFVAEHDVEQMSTRDLKEALQENKELKRKLEEKDKQVKETSAQLDTAIAERQKMQERLNETVNQNAGYEKSLQVKIDAAKKLEQEKKAAEEKRRESEQKVQQLQRQIDALKEQKSQPDQQMIGQLRAEAEKQAQQQFQEQIEKLTQEKERAEQKAQQAEERNRQLESKASSVQSKELIVFDEKFKAFQDNYNQLNSLIAKMEDATAGKVREAVKKLLGVMTENLG